MEIHKLGYEIDKPEVLDEYPKFIVKIDDRKDEGFFLVLPLEKSAQHSFMQKTKFRTWFF